MSSHAPHYLRRFVMEKDTSVDGSWLGWIGFASFMLLLGGFFSAIAGFAALFKDGVVLSGFGNNIWLMTYVQWGWVHILIGVLAIVAAGSLLAGHMYGRIIAIVVAFLSALVNMAFVPVYPIWSIIVIFIDVMVIYSVMVHGGDLKEA